MEILFTDPLRPFWISFAVILLLLLVEITLMLLGLSTSLESGDAELGNLETSGGLDFDGGIDLQGLDLPEDGVTPALLSDAIARSNEKPAMISPKRSLLDRLGLTRVPVAVWLSALLLSFASFGILLQLTLNSLFGMTLPAMEASLLVVPVSFYVTRFLAEIVGNFFPKIESSAMTRRMLSNHRGELVTGPARRGRAGEVRLLDRHGNLHYLMAEPYFDDAEIAPGSEVALLRLRNNDLRITPLS